MKVLQVVPSLCGGGTQRFVAQLVEYQNCLGMDSRACVFLPGVVDTLWGRNARWPIELDYKPVSGVGGRLATIPLVRRLRQVIQHERPDVVHTHLWPACRIVYRATTGLGIRHVWHVHETQAWLDEQSSASFLRRVQMRMMSRCSDAFFIACSDAARRLTMKGLHLSERQIVTVMNGVDVSEFYSGKAPSARPASPVKVIMTAAFRPMKGHACLIEALSILRRDNVPFLVTLAGDLNSATGATIRTSVNANRLADRISFPGHIEDVPEALRAHDVFVLPSESEGLPLAMLEAMSCGLPVVVTRIGGMPEVVVEGKTGFLVAPRNPVELAECLRKLIKSPQLRIEMGRRASKFVRKSFSFRHCAQRIIKTYETLKKT